MKRFLVTVSLAVLLAGPAFAAASGGMAPMAPNAQGSLDPYRQMRKQHAIKQIRDEALKQQTADGGKLTDEHRAAFQQRLDAVRAGNY